MQLLEMFDGAAQVAAPLQTQTRFNQLGNDRH